MTVNELYDYITSQMTAEEALRKFLEGSLIKYEKLKIDPEDGAVHPLIIIAHAAMDLGWQFCLERTAEDAEMDGVMVGTEEYMDRQRRLFKREPTEN